MKNKLIIVYDNGCPSCTRFITFVKKLDWFNALSCEKLRGSLAAQHLKGLDVTLAKQQMASYNGMWRYGFISIYLIFLKLPLFWLLVPFLMVIRITGLGQSVYKEVALRRKLIPLHCDGDPCASKAQIATHKEAYNKK